MTTQGETLNLEKCIERLKECHPLKESEVKALCGKVKKYIKI